MAIRRGHKRLLKLLLITLAAGAGVWFGLPWLLPLPQALNTPQTPSPRYLSKDGIPLRMLLTQKGDRVAQVLRFEEIPTRLIQATLAAEDKRFFDHGGVDLLAIGRAARDNLSSRRIVSGASTVHQQLVKVAAARTGKRTLKVKMIEALQARRLAMQWSKEQVITEYLNRISYGNLLTGCASAAQGYFYKPLADLTPAECALLAAIPQSPTRYNPFRQLTAIRPRQLRILGKMRELGWLSEEQLRVAQKEPLKLSRFHGGFEAPHAVEMLRPEPRETTVTTLDAGLQRQIETIITQRLAALKERHVTQAAAVVIENATGHVLALAGSRDFFATDGGQINGAWVPHSPGSAIKPFTYLLALERGATAASIVADLPIEYTTPTGTYRPENYAHKLYGPVTYRQALGNSLNISAVKVLSSIGGTDTLLKQLQDLGLTTLTEPAEHYGLGLTIGNAPVRLVELANAYACLARLGIDRPWSLIAQPENTPPKRRFDEASCYIIASILSDNQARQLTFGQYSPLRLPFPVAVKTGTSTAYRDNWCVGYTPEFTVAVWAGNFDNTPMQEVSGVTGAAPIWRDVFIELQSRFGVTWYMEPPGLIHARIDPRTGKRLTPQSPPARISREEIFVIKHLPPAASAEDYDTRGRALLRPEYATWVRSADNWMGDLVAIDDSAQERPWRISNPIPGTVVRLDPDLPQGGRRLLLETTPHREVAWECATLPIQMDGTTAYVELIPGRHELRAMLPTGQGQSTYIIVHPE
ncbi:penicillin-binding protein 1C [Prosthecobacter fusiformis]|uniref:peptidoglycan glycosyltransferase n=1 Tax=Prosthecobacter fusiformis TaxID=48464 RepID=A0A4R7RSA6_9BACT|nr:transglycosylase domain-containing protein [Prosthecobacter fusiformis]TDU68009.1 penicillin-binding protein 1C [Prosthecobacter fusiformis]